MKNPPDPAPGPGQRIVDTAALVARRRELYPSRVAFARTAEVSLAWIKMVEGGARQPGRHIARALAAALEWDVDKLYLPDDADDAAA